MLLCIKSGVILTSIEPDIFRMLFSIRNQIFMKAFSVITSRANILWRGRVFWPTKGTGGLQHDKFLIIDGKQHPKNIWFSEC